MNESLSSQWDESRAYCFVSRSSQIEFVQVEEEMTQMNDYCAECLGLASSKLSSLQEEQADLTGKGWIKGADIDGEELDVLMDDVAEGMADDILSWKDTLRFMAPATCLIMLSAFTEKSLLQLCISFGEKPPTLKGGQSKIVACIAFLNDSCGLVFTEPEATFHVRERCRQLRNAFAHGEWDLCRQLIDQISVREHFASVAALFAEIETAYIRKNNAR